MRSLSLLDLAFLGKPSGLTRDNMESYANLAAVTGLNGGRKWAGAYSDLSNFMGLQAHDNMEQYADTSPLDGLELGNGWAHLDPSEQAYSDNWNFTGELARDNMESYSNGADVNGLNGGTTRDDLSSWTAYVDR